MEPNEHNARRHPDWIKQKIPSGELATRVRNILASTGLHTICEEARCPNRGECWSSGTATFLILGDCCTRDCTYCSVASSPPEPPSPEEPQLVAGAVASLACNYVVITSVTRDDLPDGGADHFAKTVRAIRRASPGTVVEILVPDFAGMKENIDTVAASRPEVLGHNLETVEALFPEVRPGASYRQSLAIFEYLWRNHSGLTLKSGLMAGLGEKREDISRSLSDMRGAGVSYVTVGQYLQPDKKCLPVQRYLPPEEFEEIRNEALNMGFESAICGPMVRSSYRAHEAYLQEKEE